jgi:hypothetical protein
VNMATKEMYFAGKELGIQKFGSSQRSRPFEYTCKTPHQEDSLLVLQHLQSPMAPSQHKHASIPLPATPLEVAHSKRSCMLLER